MNFNLILIWIGAALLYGSVLLGMVFSEWWLFGGIVGYLVMCAGLLFERT